MQRFTFVIGGHINFTHTYPAENFTAQVNCFDHQSNTWLAQPFAPRPTATQGFQAATWGNYIYAFGGLKHVPNSDPAKAYQSIADIDRYDVTTNTWETVAKLPRPRSSNVIVVDGSLVYLIGGWTGDGTVDNGGTFLSEIDRFDLSTGEVSTATTLLPTPLRRALSAISYRGSGLLVGGITSPFNTVSNFTLVESKDSEPVFSDLPPLPEGVFAPGTVYIPEINSIFAFGGYILDPNGPSENFTNQVLAFNFSDPAGMWVQQRPMGTSRGFVQPVYLGNGNIGILAGALDPARSGPQSDEFELYAVDVANFKDRVI